MNYLLCSESFYVNAESVWFSAFFHNGLYRIERASGRIESVVRFSGEKGMKSRLYGKVVQSGRYLVFAPLAAHAIAIYHLDTHELKMLPVLEIIDRHKAAPDKSMKFWTSVAYKNKVFLFGWDYPAIVELVMDSKTIHYHTKWMDELDGMVSKSKRCYLGVGAVRENHVYLPLLCGNFLMRFDMETAEYTWMEVECDIKGFAGVSAAGEDMWLVPGEYKDIIRWNPESGVKKLLKVPYVDRGGIGVPFYSPLIGEKGIYIFPVGMNEVYFIDPEKDIIYRHERLSEILAAGSNSPDNGLAVINPAVTREGIFFGNQRDGSWHLYNETTGEDKVGFLKADRETMAYIDRLFLDDALEKGEFIGESSDFSLTNLLACLK